MGLPLPDAPHSACAQGCPGAGTCEMGRRETPPDSGVLLAPGSQALCWAELLSLTCCR